MAGREHESTIQNPPSRPDYHGRIAPNPRGRRMNPRATGAAGASAYHGRNPSLQTRNFESTNAGVYELMTRRYKILYTALTAILAAVVVLHQAT